VEKLLKRKLKSIESGIKVVSVQLRKSDVPRQVKKAYDTKNIATQDRSKYLSEAKTKAEELLTETAGSVERAHNLYKTLHDDSISDEEKELLWSQVSGKLRTYLFNARVYATEVVKNAEASAKYLQSLLPEYRRRPDIVINRLYHDTMEQMLANAEEKFIVQPPRDADGNTLWITLNRDNSLGKKSKEGQKQNQD
jgi:membrane protease subunit HflK